MTEYVTQVMEILVKNRSPDNARYMKAYMKNKFEFLGIKSPERRSLCRSFLEKAALPPIDMLWEIVRQLWELPEREYQYFGMELVAKYLTFAKVEWKEQYKYCIINKSWWDTVDFIAISLVGDYFIKFPDQILPTTSAWMQSGNIWLQRSCLLFQMKYKENTDTDLLSSHIISLSSSKEFFIAKAIGWALRTHAKYDPDWVKSFVENNALQALSKREALRHII